MMNSFGSAYPRPGRFLGAVWGYWAGGLLALLSVVSLGLGLYPMSVAAREKIKMVSVPGQTELHLKMPGAYVGIMGVSGQSASLSKSIQELEYSLIDQETQEPIPVEKVPSTVYASDKMDNRVPLFQFVVHRPGNYILDASYPYYLDGPSAQIVLINTDVGYVWRELIVGGIVCLIFGALSIYCFVKTYRQRHPGKKNK